MSFVDFLLNTACLLLWLNYRTYAIARRAAPAALTLPSLVKRAEPRREHRWAYLAGLAVVLGLRGLFYWQIGPAADWTPRLDLGVVVVALRSDYWERALIFSVLSFLRFLTLFYLWLILLSVVNRGVPSTDPVQRLVRGHLGWLERWPGWLKLVLPWGVICLGWYGAATGLSRLDILPPAQSDVSRWGQAALVGLCAYLSWKFLISGVLFLHLVNSYLYLGQAPFWTFLAASARHLLRPLRFLPLQVSKLDFAPLVGIALVLFLAEWAERQLAALHLALAP